MCLKLEPFQMLLMKNKSTVTTSHPLLAATTTREIGVSTLIINGSGIKRKPDSERPEEDVRFLKKSKGTGTLQKIENRKKKKITEETTERMEGDKCTKTSKDTSRKSGSRRRKNIAEKTAEGTEDVKCIKMSKGTPEDPKEQKGIKKVQEIGETFVIAAIVRKTSNHDKISSNLKNLPHFVNLETRTEKKELKGAHSPKNGMDLKILQESKDLKRKLKSKNVKSLTKNAISTSRSKNSRISKDSERSKISESTRVLKNSTIVDSQSSKDTKKPQILIKSLDFRVVQEPQEIKSKTSARLRKCIVKKTIGNPKDINETNYESNNETNIADGTIESNDSNESNDSGGSFEIDNDSPDQINNVEVNNEVNEVKDEIPVWLTKEVIHELWTAAEEACKHNQVFTMRGCRYATIRNALVLRGWVEKLDIHRRNLSSRMCKLSQNGLIEGLPKRNANESEARYMVRCKRNIMSRFLAAFPISFLWTMRRNSPNYLIQTRNPSMFINKFQIVPFVTKEGLCTHLKNFHWFYEEGVTDMYFPRCFNVFRPKEFEEFTDNFKLTACISYLRCIVYRFKSHGYYSVFSSVGKIPYCTIDFAVQRCKEYIDICEHKDIDTTMPEINDTEWNEFLDYQYNLINKDSRILFDLDDDKAVQPNKHLATVELALDRLKEYWPQYNLDGYLNLWIIKPSNRCRGQNIMLTNKHEKIFNHVNPKITWKRFVVQKYIERPLIIHHTKFDIRQWVLVTGVQPLVIWMYKECYLRFSSREFSLNNHHESVHLTNHAIQRKYSNDEKRDIRLPSDNMWDNKTFEEYLSQNGMKDIWSQRIYPGMCKIIVGAMLASQENMEPRANTFELYGADFVISQDYYPWLLEINSNPDMASCSKATRRLCPQVLRDLIKVVVDRRKSPDADTGSFELIFHQTIPPFPLLKDLGLCVRAKKIEIPTEE